MSTRAERDLLQEREEARKRQIPGWKDYTTGRPLLSDESFGEFLQAKSERNADKVYAFSQEDTVTYRQLGERTARVANSLLDLGAKKGEKIAVMMFNRPEFLYSTYAAEAIAAVHVVVNVALRGDGLAYIINQSESETVIIEQQFLDALKAVQGDLKRVQRVIVLPTAEANGHLPFGCIPFGDLYRGSPRMPHIYRQAGDMVKILYTSGTTGLPKGTVRRHPVPPNPARDAAQLPYCQNADDITYIVLPFFHAVGYGQCTRTLELEGTLAMARRFSASRFWQEARQWDCTTFSFAGSIPHILLKQPPRPDDKQHKVRCGDGYAPIGDIRDEFMERFGVMLIERYATSDGGGGLRNIPGDRPNALGGDTGVGRLVKVLDQGGNECPPHVIGEICSRPRDAGALPTVEYYNKPEASAEKVKGGWFHTGDFGYRDEEGWLFFSDRERQFIRRRGENVSSFEVESVVSRHPQVLESAAVGVRSEFEGDQEIKVCVVLKPGACIKPEELIAHCEQRMAYYMVPRYVEFRDELPKTGTERVQKFKLVDEGITSAMWDREKAGYKLKR